MPYTKSGNIFCPCCGTKITVTNEDGKLVATVRQIINAYDHITEHQEEASPQGDVRPDSVSARVHAKKGSSESAEARFDRTTYQRKYMKPYMAKRRAEARRPKE